MPNVENQLEIVLSETDQLRYWAKVLKTKKCWNWGASKSYGGYGQFSLKGKLLLAHRIAWTLENGAVDRGTLVLHKCDNPSCVRPSHLFLGSHADNSNDKVSKGRASSWTSKGLSFDVRKKHVLEIRKLLLAGVSIRRIAAFYKVPTSVITIIKNSSEELEG